MAWPNTPFRTMVDGSTYWDAALGNALQSGVNNISTRQASLAGLYVDGVGGNPLSALTATSPLVTITDAGGSARSTYDYLGYRLGSRLIEINEDWVGYIGASSLTASANPLPGFQRWQLSLSGTGSNLAQMNGAATALNTPGLQLRSGTVTNAYSAVTTSQYPVFMNTTNAGIIAAMEADVALPSTSGSWTFAVGFSTSIPLNTANDLAAFLYVNSSTSQWLAQTQNGAAPTTTSPFPLSVVAGTAYRLRIELHGSSSPYGSCARFFVNGTLATATTNVPNSNIATAVPIGLGAVMETLDTATHTLQLGHVGLVVNRYNVAPGL